MGGDPSVRLRSERRGEGSQEHRNQAAGRNLTGRQKRGLEKELRGRSVGVPGFLELRMSIRQPSTLYFCDEASQRGEAFMCLGGLAVDLRAAILLEDRLLQVRQECGVQGEVKWSKAKARRNSVHRSYAYLLHELTVKQVLHLHLMFVPMQKYFHNASGERNRIDTVSKQYYQLILHRPIRFYGLTHVIHIRPDNGECTQRLPSFRSALNRDGKRVYGAEESVWTIEPSCSATSRARNFLQLLDVTLGAMTAVRNNRFSACADTFKAKLTWEIWELWGCPDLTKNTYPPDQHFNVWNVVPSWTNVEV